MATRNRRNAERDRRAREAARRSASSPGAHEERERDRVRESRAPTRSNRQQGSNRQRNDQRASTSSQDSTATPTDTRQQRQPRTFRSRDGRVTYNERGQRLDSHGNVARRTNRSRRRDARNRAREAASDERTTGLQAGAASDERTTGLRSPAVAQNTAVNPAQQLPANPLQLPWLAFQNGQVPQFGVNPVNPQGNSAVAPQFGVNPVDPNGFPAQQPPVGIPTGGTGGNPFATLGIPGPGQNINPWAGLDDNQINRALAYWNAVLPYAQFNQNAFQNQRDFDETVRRFGLEFPQRQREAAFNAAGRAQLPNQRFI